MRKKKPKLKRKRVHQNVNNVSVPPIGTPSWCLNNEALEKFNRSTNDIPVYDDGDTGDTDEEEIHDNSNHNTSENDDDNDSRRDNSSKKRKKNKHKKKSKKKRKEEKHKSKRK